MERIEGQKQKKGGIPIKREKRQKQKKQRTTKASLPYGQWSPIMLY